MADPCPTCQARRMDAPGDHDEACPVRLRARLAAAEKERDGACAALSVLRERVGKLLDVTRFNRMTQQWEITRECVQAGLCEEPATLRAALEDDHARDS